MGAYKLKAAAPHAGWGGEDDIEIAEPPQQSGEFPPPLSAEC